MDNDFKSIETLIEYASTRTAIMYPKFFENSKRTNDKETNRKVKFRSFCVCDKLRYVVCDIFIENSFVK